MGSDLVPSNQNNSLTKGESGGAAMRGAERGLMAGLEAAAVESIRAHFVLARQFRRQWSDVRVRLLAECKRPEFAAAAWYDLTEFNRGEGFSVRFADSAAREMGNIIQRAQMRYTDDDMVIFEQQVIDFETNFVTTVDVMIRRVVERQAKSAAQLIQKGRIVLDEGRKTSRDGWVFLVRATDDEMRQKINSELARARRECTLRVLPADIRQACKEMVLHTRHLGDKAVDPTEERKNIEAAFAEQNIMPSELTEFLGHALDRCQPAELVKLRELYKALREGEVVWDDVLSQRRNERDAARVVRDEEERARIKAADTAIEEVDAKAEAKAEEQPPQPKLVREPETPKLELTVEALWSESKQAGLNKAKVTEALRELFGQADPAKLTGHDRWLFVFGWLSKEPDYEDAPDELAARRRELGTLKPGRQPGED